MRNFHLENFLQVLCKSSYKELFFKRNVMHLCSTFVKNLQERVHSLEKLQTVGVVRKWSSSQLFLKDFKYKCKTASFIWPYFLTFSGKLKLLYDDFKNGYCHKFPKVILQCSNFLYRLHSACCFKRMKRKNWRLLKYSPVYVS